MIHNINIQIDYSLFIDANNLTDAENKIMEIQPLSISVSLLAEFIAIHKGMATSISVSQSSQLKVPKPKDVADFLNDTSIWERFIAKFRRLLFC